LKIPIAEPFLGEEELNNAVEAIRTGWISSRASSSSSSRRSSLSIAGVRHGVATSNGTVALHLALKALGSARAMRCWCRR